MWKCNKCNQYRFDNAETCTCKKYTVVDNEGEEHILWADSELEAALKFAQQTNEENDHWLMNTSVSILVNGEAYRISAEPDVHYSADKL